MIEAIIADHGAINVLVNWARGAARHPVNQFTRLHYLQALNAKFCPYISTQHAVLVHFIALAQPSPLAVVNMVGIGAKVAMSEHIARCAAMLH